ncbi:MAG TPA: pitrilysin family protein [Bacteroidia bacterium]|nr:pitrilysin family protein [Bacteroidia bacterium]
MKISTFIRSGFLFLLSLQGLHSHAQEIVELKQPNAGKVVIKYMFRNGSIADPAGKEGITYLTANLMVNGGTEKHSSTEIQKMIYPWAARMSCFTDKEVSTFTFEVPSEYLEKYYSLIKEMILHPAFGDSDFERMKSNQKNYVDEVIRQSSDEEYGKKVLEYVLFKGTPYQHLTQGTSASLLNLQREEVMAHFHKAFTRSNLIVGIAGQYPESFPEMMLADLKTLPEGPAPLPELVLPEIPQGITVDIVSKDGAIGTAISAGFPLNVTRQSTEFSALMVANSWLGEHRKSYSRLYQKIREQRSMNYGDYTYIEWYENGGGNMLPVPGTPRHLNYFSIWLRPVQTAKSLKSQYKGLDSLTEGHARFALRMALREYYLLVNTGMTQEQFEETRNFLLSYTKLYIETTSKNLGFLMDSRFYDRKNWITELNKELQHLKVEDVNTAMKNNFLLEKMNIVIITDKSEVEGLKKGFESGSNSPMVYSPALQGSLPEAIFIDDREVEQFPIKVQEVRVIDSEHTFGKK